MLKLMSLGPSLWGEKDLLLMRVLDYINKRDFKMKHLDIAMSSQIGIQLKK